MKKKITKILLCTAMSSALLFGCGQGNVPASSNDTTAVTSEDSSVSSKQDSNNNNVTDQNAEDPNVSQNQANESNTTEISIKEPEIKDVSNTEKTIFFYRNDLKIFAKLRLPEGDGPFPLVILSYGSGGVYTQTDNIAQIIAKEGIAALAFDFIGTERGSQSDGLITDASALTQAEDIIAIIDSLDYLPYIDKNNVFLWGHSLGGYDSTVAAIQRPDAVHGLIAVEPAYHLKDMLAEAFPNIDEVPDVIYNPFYCGKKFVTDAYAYDIYDYLPNYKNKVLIIAGDKAPSIGAEGKEYLDRAEEVFPSATQVIVAGANHSFEGDSKKEMLQISIQFVKDNLK